MYGIFDHGIRWGEGEKFRAKAHYYCRECDPKGNDIPKILWTLSMMTCLKLQNTNEFSGSIISISSGIEIIIQPQNYIITGIFAHSYAITHWIACVLISQCSYWHPSHSKSVRSHGRLSFSDANLVLWVAELWNIRRWSAFIQSSLLVFGTGSSQCILIHSLDECGKQWFATLHKCCAECLYSL